MMIVGLKPCDACLAQPLLAALLRELPFAGELGTCIDEFGDVSCAVSPSPGQEAQIRLFVAAFVGGWRACELACEGQDRSW